MKYKSYLIILIIFFSINFLTYGNQLKFGMTRVFSIYNEFYKEFHLELEDGIMATLSNVQSIDLLALNIESSHKDFKTMVNEINDTTNDILKSKYNSFNELKEVDYCIAFEVTFLHVKKEMDFYDTDKYWTIANSKLKLLIIDTKNWKIIDEKEIEVITRSSISIEKALRNETNLLIKRINSYIIDNALFKTKVQIDKKGPLFIKLNKGLNDGIKTQDILISYKDSQFILEEKTLIKIIKSNEYNSIASILYSKGKLTKYDTFTKTQKIDLEIQIGGGFVMADRENPVSVATPYLSFLSFGLIRALIPVKLPFFRPTAQFELNFFYQDNKVLLPFSFETGCQGEFNIHRFGIDAGFLIGALFSPDKSNNYILDSVIIRPYIHLSGMIISSIELFGEFGYKYFLKGNFYKNWNIDLKGPYFCFGIGINL